MRREINDYTVLRGKSKRGEYREGGQREGISVDLKQRVQIVFLSQLVPYSQNTITKIMADYHQTGRDYVTFQRL